MRTTQRVRRASMATVAALVIGGSGVAVGTAIAEPATTGRHGRQDDTGRHPRRHLPEPGQLRGRRQEGAALGGADPDG